MRFNSCLKTMLCKERAGCIIGTDQLNENHSNFTMLTQQNIQKVSLVINNQIKP